MSSNRSSLIFFIALAIPNRLLSATYERRQHHFGGITSPRFHILYHILVILT